MHLYLNRVNDMTRMYDTCILKKTLNYNNTIRITNIMNGNATNKWYIFNNFILNDNTLKTNVL